MLVHNTHPEFNEQLNEVVTVIQPILFFKWLRETTVSFFMIHVIIEHLAINTWGHINGVAYPVPNALIYILIFVNLKTEVG